MRALEVEKNLNLKAVQLTKSGLRVFGFCPAGSTQRDFFRLSPCFLAIRRRPQEWQIQITDLTIPIAFLCWRGHTHNL